MTSAADRALAFVDHLRIDPESDAILEGLVRGLMSQADRAALVAHGDEDLRPWQALTDPATAPLWALPYAAQWTGGQMPPRRAGEDEAAYTARARHEVVYPRGMRRGSSSSVLAAIRDLLIGERTVIFRERFGGDPWLLMVVTRLTETPDPDAIRQAIRQVLPAGIVLVIEHRNTRDWAEVLSTWATWGDVLSDNDDWREVLEVPDP